MRACGSGRLASTPPHCGALREGRPLKTKVLDGNFPVMNGGNCQAPELAEPHLSGVAGIEESHPPHLLVRGFVRVAINHNARLQPRNLIFEYAGPRMRIDDMADQEPNAAQLDFG